MPALLEALKGVAEKS